MKKIIAPAPSITIWKLELSDKENGVVLQNLYFLSYKKANRFRKKHKAELEDYNVSLWKLIM